MILLAYKVAKKGKIKICYNYYVQHNDLVLSSIQYFNYMQLLKKKYLLFLYFIFEQ